VLLFEELNEQRLETRKVEEYADGSRLRSDRVAPELSATLSWEPIPPRPTSTVGRTSRPNLSPLRSSKLSGATAHDGQ
jgi:hypothetical protein